MYISGRCACLRVDVCIVVCVCVHRYMDGQTYVCESEGVRACGSVCAWVFVQCECVCMHPRVH